MIKITPVKISEQNWSNELTPTVTVFNWVYNHKDFIRQSIDSILMQETTFKVEIIIQDDASNDGTREIIEEYQANYPNLFKNILFSENQFSQGKSIMNSLFEKPRGKYITLAHGDDYWTDTQKLQKQFDYLEKNPDYLLCGHRIIEEKGSQFFEIKNDKKTFTFSDFSISGSCNGLYTCSFFFINSSELLNVFIEDWSLKLDGGDHLLLLLSTVNGHKVGLLNDLMGVYRIHEGGVWSSSSVEKKVKDAIINNRLYIQNLKLSKIQKDQIVYGLTPRIRQFYYAHIQNKFLRKGISILLKILFISGPGYISNRLVHFFSNRILSKS